MITDFENALINGIKFSYPECRIRYCVFHYSQAVFKNLFDAGLKNLYITDVEVRLNKKCLLTIIFVHTGHRYNLFVSIKNWLLARTKKDIQMIKFITYFDKNWINKVYFDKDDLYDGINNDTPFTNNHAEGFHSGFEKQFKKPHPNIVDFVATLRIHDYLKEVEIHKAAIDDINTYSQFESRTYEELKETILELGTFDDMIKIKKIASLYAFREPFGV